jgi:hypothetical protein
LKWSFRENALKALKSGRAVVINLGDSKGAGTHWVAAIVIDGVLYYADPFGSMLGGYPPEEIDVFDHAIVNRIPFQRLETTLCGYYSVCFALAMNYLPRHTQLSQKDFEDLLASSIA